MGDLAAVRVRIVTTFYPRNRSLSNRGAGPWKGYRPPRLLDQVGDALHFPIAKTMPSPAPGRANFGQWDGEQQGMESTWPAGILGAIMGLPRGSSCMCSAAGDLAYNTGPEYLEQDGRRIG